MAQPRKPRVNEGTGKPEGFQMKTYANGRGGNRGKAGYWEWDGSAWNKIDASEFRNDNSNETLKVTVPLIGPGTLKGKKPDGTSKRWPQDTLTATTDYIFFQFGKYKPPFSRDAEVTNAAKAYEMYQGSTDIDPEDPSVVLPMPQDLSNESAQTWQGKQFSAVGRAAVAALAGGSMSYANNKIKDFESNWKAIQTSLTTAGLNAVPGVGGNLTMNDVSGSTRGIVLNPNAELLYDSPTLREIGMTFKMVPRNKTEADIILDIVKLFRRHSMPSWGTADDKFTANQTGKNDEIESTATMSGESFIHVPSLCKFTFMSGSNTNEKLPQFKPCGISKVQVNYTPDGTYATYDEGYPVATELQLNFIETKAIFRQDVDRGF